MEHDSTPSTSSKLNSGHLLQPPWSIFISMRHFALTPFRAPAKATSHQQLVVAELPSSLLLELTPEPTSKPTLGVYSSSLPWGDNPPHLSKPHPAELNFSKPSSLGRFLLAHVLVPPLLEILDSLLESLKTCGRPSPCITWVNVEQPHSLISPQVRTHNIFFTCSFIPDPLPSI